MTHRASVILLVDQRAIAQVGNDFALISPEDGRVLQEYKVGPIAVQYPKIVVVAEDDSLVVGGTDQGCAILFDLQRGIRLQELPYNDGLLVQAVSVRNRHAQATHQFNKFLGLFGEWPSSRSGRRLHPREGLQSCRVAQGAHCAGAPR